MTELVERVDSDTGGDSRASTCDCAESCVIGGRVGISCGLGDSGVGC